MSRSNIDSVLHRFEWSIGNLVLVIYVHDAPPSTRIEMTMSKVFQKYGNLEEMHLLNAVCNVHHKALQVIIMSTEEHRWINERGVFMDYATNNLKVILLK